MYFHPESTVVSSNSINIIAQNGDWTDNGPCSASSNIASHGEGEVHGAATQQGGTHSVSASSSAASGKDRSPKNTFRPRGFVDFAK